MRGCVSTHPRLDKYRGRSLALMRTGRDASAPTQTSLPFSCAAADASPRIRVSANLGAALLLSGGPVATHPQQRKPHFHSLAQRRTRPHASASRQTLAPLSCAAADRSRRIRSCANLGRALLRSGGRVPTGPPSLPSLSQKATFCADWSRRIRLLSQLYLSRRPITRTRRDAASQLPLSVSRRRVYQPALPCDTPPRPLPRGAPRSAVGSAPRRPRSTARSAVWPGRPSTGTRRSRSTGRRR